MSDDELIARYVEVDPHKPGPSNVRLRDSAVRVRAIVSYYLQNGQRVKSTADGYGIPEIEVEAALAFYRKFKWAIDAKLAENSEFELPSIVNVS